MPTLCLADLLVVLLWHAAFPGCLHDFLAPSSLTFLLQQEICCNGHFLLPSLGLLRHHFLRCQLLSLLITSLCWLSPLWYQAEIISLHLQALLEPIPTLPINLHSLSGGWLPRSSAISKHLCYFLPRLGRNSSLKKIAVLSPFLPALVLTKTFFCAGQAQILPLFCLTCCPPGWLKLPCALSCTPFLGLVFHVCGKQGLCFHALSNTMGIPSLWQPPVTHCIGACLGRRRGREGKVHRVFKKLLSLPLNTFFDTPQHRPSRGTQCKPPGPLPQPPPAISRGVLQPGFLQECRELHRMLSDIALQSETEGVLLSGKPKSASKNWEFGWYPAPSVQLCFSHCPAVSFPLGWVVGKVRFLPSPRALLFRTAPCVAVRCVLPPLCDYP